MVKKIELPIEEIVRLYKYEHINATELANRYNVSIGTILKHLYNNDIPKIYPNCTHNQSSSHKIILSKSDTDEIIRLYTVEHLASLEIGKRFNISFPTVIRILRENNIPILDSKHDKTRCHNKITISEMPDIIHNFRHLECTGEVICPICRKTRRLTISRARIKEIVSHNGRCNKCAMKAREIPLDIETIKHLYIVEHMTTKQIGKLFDISCHTISKRLKDNNINIRQRSEAHTRRITNKGTLELPILGDICRGTNLGLNDTAYYHYVVCPNCRKERWQMQSHIKRSPLCRECSLKLMGLNRRGENAPTWKGGLSFLPYPPEFNVPLKEQIRIRDNYTCQLCGKQENGIKLSIHHIDYNKNNLDPNNLICLCSARKGKQFHDTCCHTKTNNNRPYWTEYFTNLLKSKGLYITKKNQFVLPLDESIQNSYRVLKDELTAIGYWRIKQRGDPEKGYKASHNKH